MENIEIVKLFREEGSLLRELIERKFLSMQKEIKNDLNSHLAHKHQWAWLYEERDKKELEEKLMGVIETSKKLDDFDKKITELIKVNETPPITFSDRYVCPNDGELY